MKILVVEDEKKVAGFIKRGLEEEGYEVDLAHDGEEGVRCALQQSYNLLIMDVMMPRKDGLTAVRELRQHGMPAPVLMLTAQNSTEDVVAGLDAGSDDYLTKPFIFAELTARVRALARRSEIGRASCRERV